MKKFILNVNFTHLRIYSEYSLKDSVNNLENIIQKAKTNDFTSLAITDKNFFAVIEFYKLCLENKIKPILGCDLFLENKLDKLNPYKLLLLVKNKFGYLNLLKLISKSNIYKTSANNFYEIKKNWLSGKLNKGLIALSGYECNDILDAFMKKNKSLLKSRILFWRKCFKNRFYLELQRFSKTKDSLNKHIIKLAKKFKIPLAATHSVYFTEKSDYILYKIKKSILNKIDLNSYNKNKFTKNCFFYSKKQMINLFKDIPSSLINSSEISKKCNLIIDLNKIKIPIYKNNIIYKNKVINNNKYLLKFSLKALKTKLKIYYKNFDFTNNFIKYKNRLIYECKIIITMGVVDYFLIVKDFIDWAKKNNIPVGPGRGSSAGSLVAFALNITDLDPIENNLIFERFLNFKRISIPDFDIDFCPFKREKVINYVKLKYGVSFISQIITFGKLASKASLKDIGRVLNINYNYINKIVKLIPFKFNNKSIEYILNNVSELKRECKNNIKIKNLFNLAIRLENNTKNLGVHAGGIIISPNKLYNFCPLILQNNIVVSQFSKICIENIGLLKFDFLGLTTLSIINKCIKLIKKNPNQNFYKLNLKDKLCFYNLKIANTMGIFQLESMGMQNLLKNFKPDSFKNIIALISLYRPGPIKLLNSFCLRRAGREKINYINEKLKIILEETYGIIIYQEQIMFITQVVSNFSLENADILRVAISKKKPEDMINLRLNFISGGLLNGFSEKLLNDIFDKIEKFSGYGFNKSHAAAYSLLAFFSLWLKTYYFSEFICSSLTYCINDYEKIKVLINESTSNNTFILPLNINESKFYFTYLEGKLNKIRYGFSTIKGIGINVVNEIIIKRKLGKFLNFINFCKRIDKNIINYKVLESLICSGAFDSININRAELITEFKKNFYKFNFCFKSNIKILLQKDFNLIHFWNFRTKLIEEKLRLGFFFINNLINIYINKFIYNINPESYNFINYINKNYIFGIIDEIQKRFNDKELYYLLTISNNAINYKIQVDINLYLKNYLFIKNYNFVIISVNKKNFFLKGNEIFNIENFKI